MRGAAPAPTPPLLVSVVVPTCRRPLLLERCLTALLRQTLSHACFEVIVVDDGHDAIARQVVERLAAANGAPLVAFTDDDAVADRRWLRQGLLGMRPEWLAQAGRVRVPRSRREGQRPTDHERMTQGLEQAEFVTANAFVWRAALMQVGGFDERFERPWREDADLQFRLEALGPLGRCDQAVVWHPARREPWGVSLRQQRNVFFDALLYRKHPRLYRRRVRPQPPWDYYLIVALTVLCIACLGAGWRLAAALAFAAAAGLVLALALRRLRCTAHDAPHVAEMLVTSALIPFLSVYWRLRGALHFRVLFL